MGADDLSNVDDAPPTKSSPTLALVGVDEKLGRGMEDQALLILEERHESCDPRREVPKEGRGGGGRGL